MKRAKLLKYVFVYTRGGVGGTPGPWRQKSILGALVGGLKKATFFPASLMAQAVLLSAALVSGATLHPCRLGLAGCALEPGHKQEDGSLWDTDTLPSIYEDGTMQKAEWRDDPRKEGGGNTSCVSIRPGTTNQWCATMCSSANPHAPDGSEASCPEAMCSCTAEARKQLNDERDEVLANWKEAESRVRGAKPLTAYPDGLPPTDLDGDDPSLPQLPRAPLPPSPLPRHPLLIPQPRTHAPDLTPTLTYPRVLRSPPFRPPGTQRWRYRRPGPTSPRRAGP